MKINKLFLSTIVATSFIATPSFASTQAEETGILKDTLTLSTACDCSGVDTKLPIDRDHAPWLGNRESGTLFSQARHTAYLPKDISLLGIATSLGISLQGKTMHQILDEMKISFTFITTNFQGFQDQLKDLTKAVQSANPAPSVTTSHIQRLNYSVDAIINAYFSSDILINTTLTFPGSKGNLLTNAPVSITDSCTITSDKYAVIRSGDRVINNFSCDGSTYQALYLTPAAKLSVLLKAMFGITDADFNTMTTLSQESGVILKNVLDIVMGTDRTGSFSKSNPDSYQNYQTIGNKVTASKGGFGTFKAVDGHINSGQTEILNVTLNAGGMSALEYLKNYAFQSYKPDVNDDASLLRALLMGVVGVPADTSC